MDNYVATSEELISLADAIRQKGGTSASLSFPYGFNTAITNLSGNKYQDVIINKTLSGFYENTRVTSIGTNAFNSCTTLTSVSFPSCINIGSYAFANCTALTEANFPACTHISSYAFQSCTALTSVSFPACKFISQFTFVGCSALTSVNFSACASIGAYAFYSCYNLISFYLTSVSSVPTLGASAFTSTPIDGYTTSAGRYGSVYVPASLYSSFLTASNWKNMSARIVSV